MVVLDGRVAVVGGDGGEQHLVGVHGPGRFWASWACSAARGGPGRGGAERGEVLVVPLERVRELFSRHPGLGDLVLRSYLLRRALAIEDGARMGIVGSRSVTDTGRLRGFAARNRLRQRWIDADDRRRRRRCANSASRRSRPWWCCGAASQGRATRATPSWPA